MTQRPGSGVRRPAARAAAALAAGAALLACGSGPEVPASAEPAVARSFERDGARLDLSLDRDVLTTVDSAALRLEVESAEADEVQFPDSTDGFGPFAVVRDEALDDRLLESGRRARGREYVLQPFLPGAYELPALTVQVNGEPRLVTDPVPVTVESVLEDPESSDLKDIADPVDVPVPWWWWALGTALLAAAAVAAAWWWKRRAAALAAPRFVPPHEAALAALDALLAEGLPEGPAVKRFYLRLSGIVRHYLEERFGLRAPEQTTEEFLAEMATGPAVGKDHQQLLRRFLEQADMVKFAKFAPGRDEIGAAVDSARRFVRQTVPEEIVAAPDRRR